MKLTVLTNILTPYRMPLFQAMAEQVDEFSVLLMTSREENRRWEIGTAPFPVQVLPGFHFRPWKADVSLHLNFGVARELSRRSPDVVLSAGFTLANLSAFAYCKTHRKTFIHWAHLSLQDGAQSSFLRRWLRHWLITNADGAIGESSHAKKAFIHYGAAPDRVLTATMALDVSGVHSAVCRWRHSEEHARLRQTYSHPILLSIGQIIKRKGYEELFAIYAHLIKRHPRASLLIVGDGADRGRLEAEAQQRGWKHVHFIGFVQGQDLPIYLALADVFVFHTLYDAFGLVLSEAMAAELPVVSSIHALATHDLIEDGITGFRIDPRDTEKSVATILHLLAMDEAERLALGRAAFQRVLPCDAVPTAKAMVKFMRDIRNGKTPRTLASQQV